MADNTDLDLSSADVREMTNWPDALIEDYITRGEIIRDLQARLAELEDKVNLHHP